ncbi:MAG: Elongation factor P [candidate division CPR2 bacterium GW2011_GWC1_39_9]|uniref:Elongation factor P n=1 Tax=candidate division CPR2 bacterium GW2011_GWC2_39_10 TaxID=1618345 RepID=A0A0G0Q0K0_UNCC2|nr:MAG: Elongation factor P [candidate division CPR2 bacterium GW2011_GWC2_39_10]KKR33603.1 MAG: Elongation factor P [candidate division CPR2 bacterium GW2011_GWC1_39_9]
MYGINDLKTGVTIEIDGAPHVVLSYQHIKMGRGGAVLKAKLKNLLTGSSYETSFKGGEKIQPARLERRSAQFTYADEEGYHFMDNQSYNQFTLSIEDLGTDVNYLKEGEFVDVSYFKDSPINVQLPIKMDFEVILAEKGVKGDTATSASKPVTIETGQVLNVPLFINQGDKIRIDTRTGSYVERVK